jgi:hypothetical protein
MAFAAIDVISGQGVTTQAGRKLLAGGKLLNSCLENVDVSIRRSESFESFLN